VVRLGREIHSYQDAQGFAWIGGAPLRARVTGASIFHYRLARPPQSMRRKVRSVEEVFHERADQLERTPSSSPLLTPLLRRSGSHPRAVQPWIARGSGGRGGPVAATLKLAHLDSICPTDRAADGRASLRIPKLLEV